MVKAPNSDIAHLHKVFQEVTGLQLGIAMLFHDEYIWSGWMSHGWGEKELRLVASYVKRQHPEERFWKPMLRFNRLIGDPVWFRDLLSMAVPAERNSRPAPTNKQQVLRDAGRSPEPPVAQERRVDEVAQEILKNGYEQLKKALE